MKRLLVVLLVIAAVLVPVLAMGGTASACTEGLTPGYWKNRGANSWPAYAHGSDFDTAFGLVGNPTGTLTLWQALTTGGGGFNALNRHAVAALLNAYDDDLDYYAPSWVRGIVQDAYENPGDWEVYKNQLQDANEMGVADD